MPETEIHSDSQEIIHGPCTVSVTWKIKKFFYLPQKVDHYIKSCTFYFLDASWYLRIYPNGKSSECTEGFISLYLVKKHSSASEHQIQYSLEIVGLNGPILTEFLMEETFVGDEDYFGWPEYLETSEMKLNKKKYVPGGVLTVLCTMRANTSEGVHTAVQTDILTGVEKLAQDFKDLLLNGDLTDLTLNVKNQEYKVHRAVLTARSAVFSAMLKHDMKEKNSAVVEIDDCDPEAFQQFLMYLYSGHVQKISEDIVCSLYYIASKYNVQELKTCCIHFMMDNLSVEVFCDVLMLSLKYEESALLENVIEFFAKNLMDILVTTKWMSFMKENLTEANELHLKAAKYYTTCKCKTS